MYLQKLQISPFFSSGFWLKPTAIFFYYGYIDQNRVEIKPNSPISPNRAPRLNESRFFLNILFQQH